MLSFVTRRVSAKSQNIHDWIEWIIMDDLLHFSFVLPAANFAGSTSQQSTTNYSEVVQVSKYRSLNHLSPTSNIVDRLFSRAKLFMTDQRKLMAPYRLGILLFLRSNKSLWSSSTLDDILRTS